MFPVNSDTNVLDDYTFVADLIDKAIACRGAAVVGVAKGSGRL